MVSKDSIVPAKIEQQYHIIRKLTNLKEFINGDFETFLRNSIEEAFSYFKCDRISYWTYLKDHHLLKCHFYYNGTNYTNGQTLNLTKLPLYLDRLKSRQLNEAYRNKKDALSKELTHNYLEAEKVEALLDYGVYDAEEVVGVLSLESYDIKWKWEIEEISFLEILCNLASNCYILQKRKQVESLLLRNQKELEEINTTLRNVLDKIEDEKKLQTKNIATNIEQNIIPQIEKIRAKINEGEYKQLINSLDNISSHFYRKVAKFNYHLTPAELKVCQLIKSGFQGKEIANSLNISYFTVETHKKNIRKKLGLTGRPVNLKLALEELDHE